MSDQQTQNVYREISEEDDDAISAAVEALHDVCNEKNIFFQMHKSNKGHFQIETVPIDGTTDIGE